MTGDLTPAEVTCLRVAIDLARRSRCHGNHPFGALLVDADGVVTAEAENTVVSEHDVTGHAETNLVRIASRRFDRTYLRSCTTYTSTEPCAMCSGAIYWCGIGRVIYSLSEAGLLKLTGSHPTIRPCPCPAGTSSRTAKGPSRSSAQHWKTRPEAFMTGSGPELATGKVRARPSAS
jgi:tRNA(Arg) A34 adenosine deaminase TadA